MPGLPSPVKNLAKELSRLPSIGPRQATRLAIFLTGPDSSESSLISALQALKGIKRCEQCFFIHQNEEGLCDICFDPKRDKSHVMVVEKETDLISIESARKYDGIYLITGEMPRSGILTEEAKKRLASFKKTRETGDHIEELIIGFSPTNLGDLQASTIKKEIGQLAKKISRLGRGLPTGGEVEFADSETLGSALEGRTEG